MATASKPDVPFVPIRHYEKELKSDVERKTEERQSELINESPSAVRNFVEETNKVLYETNELLLETMQMITGGDPRCGEKHEISCLFDELIKMRDRAFATRERVLAVKHMLFGD